MTFTAHVNNDFQFKNLYVKQFGPCTYAPPLPKNPTTTTHSFPKFRDIASCLGKPDEDGTNANGEAKKHRKKGKKKANGKQGRRGSSFRRGGGGGEGGTSAITASTPDVGGAASSRGGSSSNLPSSPSSSTGSSFWEETGGYRWPFEPPPGEDDKKEKDAQHKADEQDSDTDSDEDFFSPGLFSFLLKGKERDDANAAVTGSPGRGGGGGGGQAVLSMFATPANRSQPVSDGRSSSFLYSTDEQGRGRAPVPHLRPSQACAGSIEVQRLQQEAWTLILDNRAMAWLEREASEKGRTAAQVRQQLLDVLTGRYAPSQSRLPPAPGRKSMGDRVSVFGDASDTHVGDASNTAPVTAAPAARGEDALPPLPSTTVVTEEDAFRRLFDAFGPFFAVISPPALLQRLRDQLDAARRAQGRGQTGAAADVVGLPLFSQFATWKEAYQHRQRWSGTPFSFFLVHDLSFNYAQVAALYVLLQLIATHGHEHTASCIDSMNRPVGPQEARLASRRRASTVDGGSASVAGGVGRQNNRERNLCPLVAMQQVTEDLLCVFEQSTSRSTLRMMLQLCSFLLDCVLDAETAARFLSRDALLRQSSFNVPGMTVIPTDTVRTHPRSPPPEPETESSDATSTPSPSQNTAPGGGDEEGAEASDVAQGHSGRSSPGLNHDLAALLAVRRFSDADFEALFDLSAWFLDAATANSRVPVNPTMLPSGSGFAAAAAVVAEQLAGNAGHRGSLHSIRLPTLHVSAADTSHGVLPASPRRGKSGRRVMGTSVSSSPSRKAAGISPSGASGANGGVLPGSAASPAVPLAAVVAARQHLYLPGKKQQYHPVGSLVEAIALYEQQRVLLLRQQQEQDRQLEVLRQAQLQQQMRVPASTNAQTTRERMRQLRNGINAANQRKAAAAAAAAAENELLTPSVLSPATTLLSTPLVVLTTYIRLHGAPWLRTILVRLFNVLRVESVLLYVNRLDLLSQLQSNTDSAPNGGTTVAAAAAAASTTQTTEVASLSRGSVAESSSRGSTAADTVGGHFTRRTERFERLEDLICQDVLYAMNEFFGALYGTRSATRLPPGVSVLLTQFAATIHLHLLGDMVLTADETTARPGSAARRVGECVRLLKQQRTAGAMRGAGGVNAHQYATLRQAHRSRRGEETKQRLIKNIEQHRLVKFILFDAWILPAMSNAVTFGYLGEEAPLHLRWNVDAFTRYLKILVNAPFAPDGTPRARRGVRMTGTENALGTYRVSSPSGVTTPPPNAASANVGGGGGGPPATSGSPYPPPLASSSNHNNTNGGTAPTHRRKRVKEDTRPPLTLPLPAFIPGIYDVSSGSLVQVAPPPPTDTADKNSCVSHGSGRLPDTLPTATAPSALLSPSELNPSQSLYSAVGLCESSMVSKMESSMAAPSAVNNASVLASVSALTFRVMDTAPWEDLSTSLRRLNESLGLVGYDPDDDEDDDAVLLGATSMAMAGNTIGGVFATERKAMRALDLFCKRVASESANNVVVSEWQVLPSVAAGCADSLRRYMTGTSPLVQQAIASRALQGGFSFSPYMNCLNGVLLHPRMAATALDNVYYNSRRLYSSLLRPLEDTGMLQLLSSLVLGQEGVPLVDTNALVPLIASIPVPLRSSAAASLRRGEADNAAATASPPAPAFSAVGHTNSNALLQRLTNEAQRLRRQRQFLSTGSSEEPVWLTSLLHGVGPADATHVLYAGRDLILRDAQVVPACFDPWWRAMVLALCVKALMVFSECGSSHSSAFLSQCQTRLDLAELENKQRCEQLIQERGGASVPRPSTAEEGAKGGKKTGRKDGRGGGAQPRGPAESRSESAGTAKKAKRSVRRTKKRQAAT